MRFLPGIFFLAVTMAAAELPDISSVSPDLAVPEMEMGAAAAGRRVRQTTPGWETTEVYHALYLPAEWNQEGRYPVIVEWAGNGDYHNAFGDVSTGRVEGSRLGYGMTAGQRCIWVCLPYLNGAGTANVIKWWGDAPGYDPEPTLRYARATVRHVTEKFGGDPARVILAGFSRGAIAANFLGLHDDETSRLWSAFVCYSQYDGVRTWPYPGSDREAAFTRLQRLKGRPQFICGESTNAAETERYLKDTGGWSFGAFTIVNTGFRNHNDAWVLRPGEARTRLRAWLDPLLR